jgi:hypothetical protein
MVIPEKDSKEPASPMMWLVDIWKPNIWVIRRGSKKIEISLRPKEMK